MNGRMRRREAGTENKRSLLCVCYNSLDLKNDQQQKIRGGGVCGEKEEEVKVKL